VAWPRLVYDGDRLVAFVMAGFDPASGSRFMRCGIWAQRQGGGARLGALV